LRAKLDEQAEHLCKLRAFLLKIGSYAIDFERLSGEDEATFDKLRREQIEHRKHDRDRYIAELDRQIDGLERKVKLIRANGGLPHPDQVTELGRLRDLKVRASRFSDGELLRTDIGF
jgi:hypothetical protein